jgi:hypothetical protein
MCRLEIEKETFNAPLRRVDNEITRLTEAVSALLMHCTILDRVLEVYHNKLWRARALTASTLVASVAVTVGVSYLCDVLLPGQDSGGAAGTAVASGEDAKSAKADAVVKASGGASKSGSGQDKPVAVNLRGSASKAGKAPEVTPSVPAAALALPDAGVSAYSELWNWQSKFTVVSWTAFCGALSTVGVILYEHVTMTNLLQTFNEKATYEAIFRSAHQKEIAANDESTLALGKLVLDAIPTSLNSEVIQKMQRVEKVELSALHRILNEDIPNLRRRASPDFPLLSTPDKFSPHSSSEELVPLSSSPSAEALERVPYKSVRALVHPDMHVHFSPSTASSPITTRDRADKKRSLQMHFPHTTEPPVLSADTRSSHADIAAIESSCFCDSVLQEGETGGIAFQDYRVDSPLAGAELGGPDEL